MQRYSGFNQDLDLGKIKNCHITFGKRLQTLRPLRFGDEWTKIQKPSQKCLFGCVPMRGVAITRPVRTAMTAIAGPRGPSAEAIFSNKIPNASVVHVRTVFSSCLLFAHFHRGAASTPNQATHRSNRRVCRFFRLPPFSPSFYSGVRIIYCPLRLRA